MKNWWCFFGLHAYTKWSDSGRGKCVSREFPYVEATVNQEFLIQHRECGTCGMKKIRREKI